MELIAFDLELNRYNSQYLFDYHGGEQSLRGEIVQIGAAKLDINGNVSDRFSLDLRPRIFRRLSPYVAKVTGITQRQLDSGISMQAGLTRFVEWCGQDAVLLEWGMDDVPVLKQNLFLNGLDESWPRSYYDLQKIFVRQYPLGEEDKLNLEAVITRLGIPAVRDYHNALADALYTADICRFLQLGDSLAQYPDQNTQMRDTLCSDADAAYCGFATYGPFYEQSAWDDSEKIPLPCCPVCAAAFTVGEEDIYVPRGKNSRYTMRICPQHGAYMLREKSIQFDGLQWSFARVYAPISDKQQKRYKADCMRIIKLRLEAQAAEQAAAEAAACSAPKEPVALH